MLTDIQSFLLRKGSYAEGVALYEKHGHIKAFKRLFAQKEDDFNHKKLIAELKKIAEVAMISIVPKKEISEIQQVKDFIPVTQSVMPVVDVASLPDVLKKINLEKGARYREMGYLHSQLKLLANNEARRISASKIKMLSLENEKAWFYLDYWGAYKTIHPDLVEKVMPEKRILQDDAVIIRERNNVRANISKWRGKLKIATGKKKEASALKIQELEYQLAEIEKKLV